MMSEHTHMIVSILVYNLLDQVLMMDILMKGKMNNFQMTSLFQSFIPSSLFIFSNAADSHLKLLERLRSCS